MLRREQTLQLPLRDRHAHRSQQHQQPRQRRLALMVVHQHEAAQFGAEMPGDPRRQRRQDRHPVRRDPTLALVAGRAHRDHQILHQKRLVALEPRAWRSRRRHHLLLDGDPRGDLAPAPPIRRLIALRRLGAFVHAARPDPRTLRQVLQMRDLRPQVGGNLLQRRDFAKQLQNQGFQLCTAQPGKRRWRWHIPVVNPPHRAGAREKFRRSATSPRRRPRSGCGWRRFLCVRLAGFARRSGAWISSAGFRAAARASSALPGAAGRGVDFCA